MLAQCWGVLMANKRQRFNLKYPHSFVDVCVNTRGDHVGMNARRVAIDGEDRLMRDIAGVDTSKRMVGVRLGSDVSYQSVHVNFAAEDAVELALAMLECAVDEDPKLRERLFCALPKLARLINQTG